MPVFEYQISLLAGGFNPSHGLEARINNVRDIENSPKILNQCAIMQKAGGDFGQLG
jgi:hypothetical protein